MFPRYLSPLLLLPLLSPLVNAETVFIGNSTQEAVQAGVRMPTNGMTMGMVEKRFGEPQKKYPPVGDPPITRWEYPGYIVYFEYDRVITSVLKRHK